MEDYTASALRDLHDLDAKDSSLLLLETLLHVHQNFAEIAESSAFTCRLHLQQTGLW